MTIFFALLIASPAMAQQLYPHNSIPSIITNTSAGSTPSGPEESEDIVPPSPAKTPDKTSAAEDAAATQKDFQRVYQEVAYPHISTGIAQNFTIVNGSVTSRLTVPNGVNARDAAAFGQLKVLQTVAAVTTTAFSTTSNAFQTTNATVTIVPTSASSRILIWACSGILTIAASVDSIFTIARNGTNLLGTNGQFDANSGTSVSMPACVLYVDSPATTSSTVYAVQIRNGNNVGTTAWGCTNCTQETVAMEIN